jgi:dihydrodipicolinate synthase/N-acetylneuraminate lyase
VNASIQTKSSSRRRFLECVAAAGGALALTPRVPSAAPASARRPGFTKFQQRLLGPIYSNPCPFTADLKPDNAAQKKGIARALRHGIGVFAATAGNTKYATLRFDEIKHVNRVMIECVAGKALAIAATGDWDTPRAVEFARYARDIGADALQVLNPTKFRDNEQDAFNHFKTVAAATRLPVVLHGHFSDALLARLVKIETVEAMKEDRLLEDYVRQQIDHGKRLVIFGGGGEDRYYVAWPHGAQAYYSTYCTFAPDIPAKVWKIIQTGDIRAAAALTAKYDYPYIRTFSHAKWHATLELFGIGTRHVRPPHKVYTDAEMRELRTFFKGQGIDPAAYRD